jgi:hypothetical protein
LNNTERRATTRVAMDLDLIVRGEPTARMLRVTNMSLDGVHVEGAADPLGAELEMDLCLPGTGEPLRLRGEVVSRGARKGRMGLRFVGMKTRARARVLECLFGDESHESIRA